MVAARFRGRRTAAWIGGHGLARDALAFQAEETHRMKLLSVILLALAILLRADPSCAATAGSSTISTSFSCDDMAKDVVPGDQHEPTAEARLCHACAFPVAGLGPQTVLRNWAELPHTLGVVQPSAGHVPEPPVPPPRAAVQDQESTF